jgi:hypothetical protein
VAGVNDVAGDHCPALDGDERLLIFESFRGGGAGDSDLWMAERACASDAFSSPANLAELNPASRAGGPSLSRDGLTLYFTTNREGGLPDVWVADRSDPSSPFGNARPVDEVNSDEDEHDPRLTSDGNELFFSSNRDGSQALWRAAWICLSQRDPPPGSG